MHDRSIAAVNNKVGSTFSRRGLPMMMTYVWKKDVTRNPLIMKPTQIKHVQDTFALVVPIAEKAAEIFYDKLFELDPSLKELFKTERKEQGKKLMTMIGSAVGGLNHLDKIVPVVQDLGRRHVSYGVTSDHYATVAAALLYTLEVGLGDAWTPEVKDSWVEVYTLLSNTMKEAAYHTA